MLSSSVSTEHVSASHTAAHHGCKACSAHLVACPHTRGAELRRPISESYLCPTRTRDARLGQFLVRTRGTERRMHQGRNAKRPATGLPKKKWCRSRFLMVCNDWKQQYNHLSRKSGRARRDTVGLAYMVDFTKAAHSRIRTARESLGAKTTLF